MGKKRVHELAKEFGLDNREVVTLLQAAGIDAKTHSSSVYEEEARTVLLKATNKTVEEPPAPLKRAGMMIVKKKKAGEDSPNATTPVEATSEMPSAHLPPVESETETDAEVEAATEMELAAEVEAPIVEAQQPVEPEPVDAVAMPEPVEVAAAEPEPAPVDEPAAEPVVEAPAAAEPPVVVETQRPRDHRDHNAARPPISHGFVPASANTQRPMRTHATLPPGAKPEGHTHAAGAPIAPGVANAQANRSKTATVVRMIDREKLLERVPQRRLGAPPGGVAPQPRGGPAQRFGRVTELKVVTDPFGRGREMIDVGRDRKGRGAVVPKGAERKERTPSKREMLEMRERASHPSRLRKKKTTKGVIKKTELTQPKAAKRNIKMRETTISIQEFAHELGVKAAEVLQRLVKLGVMTNINGSIDFETAQLVAAEFQYTVDSTAFAENDILEAGEEKENPEDLVSRPPVVTVMGHVDHGKTSLLDAIRKARVAAGEAGGITQHIGAYQVPVKGKGSVTFLDTPGHAAFTEMRARGAQVTDIVVLVVAADDGVMPQTEEAIRHAQAAKVPIIVAINKADKPEAQPERVMQALTKYELVSEAWGGETMMVPTSATKGTGIQELLDGILLQAEMLELKANPKRSATGVVVEAKLDKGRGPVVTILVDSGTLRQGDPIVVGDAYGKVRAMANDQGKQLKEAGPSCPVEVTGLDMVPEAGDVLNVVETAEAAREVAEHRREQKRTAEMVSGPKMSLEQLMAKMKGGEVLDLKIVLKADVKGSVEAISAALVKLTTPEVKVSVIHSGVGAVNESDIMLASASKGIIVGFNVRPDANARNLAEREGVQIRTYSIIYEVLDDVRKAQEGLLAPEVKEKLVGHAEVRDLFKVSKVGTIAGCKVTDGKAMRAGKVRVLRDSVPVFEGKVASLKHFKNDAREVEAGMECGVGVEGYNDVKVGDVFEFFQVEEVARTLENASAPGKRTTPEVRP